KNWQNNPDDTNVDAMINAFRPTNKYQVDVMYRKDKWSGTLFGEIYSGLNSRYYTNDRFFVLGLSANYQPQPNVKLYFVVDNITNTSYETKVSSIYKYGAFPQPSRSFMAGVQYKL
ncbi:MAG: TonB-dependent receptor, partial [Sporomusa sp.]